jgi:FkbM family methyltransferase
MPFVMIQRIRIKLIKYIIDLNERLVFERRLRNYYRSVFGDNLKTVVDVGANKGQSIDFFKIISKECAVYAFEPNKTLYNKLLEKYKTDKKVKIFNMGVSDSLGTKEFYQNVLDYTSSFEPVNQDSAYLQKKAMILGVKSENIVNATYDVETTTLSHFINTTLNSPIDVLKIDVEGHEYPCLLGLFDQKLNVQLKYIQLEQHNDDMYANATSFEEITKLLNKNGFMLKTTVRHGFGNLDEVIFENSTLK